MGKRELLLVAAFVVVGVIVYQATSPPAKPGARGVSLSRIIDHLRREIRGNRAHAETTSTTTHTIDQSVTDLRLRVGQSATLGILGEERADLQAELHVRSNGYDDGEALQLAKQTALKIDQAGATVILSIEYPVPGTQTATLTLKVPLRMRVRIDQSGPTKVSNVADVELAQARGDTTIDSISGRVSGQHRNGTLTVHRIGSLRLTGRNSDLRISDIKGDVTLSLQTGDLKGADVGGAVEIDASQADIILEKMEKTRGTMRINAVAGSVTIVGLRTDARIDGRNTEIDVVIDEAAPLAIYNEGDDDIALTPPPGGYRIDAVARGGKIVVPGKLLEVTNETNEQRAAGVVKGGGPTITLRANRGDITVRSREAVQ